MLESSRSCHGSRPTPTTSSARTNGGMGSLERGTSQRRPQPNARLVHPPRDRDIIGCPYAARVREHRLRRRRNPTWRTHTTIAGAGRLSIGGRPTATQRVVLALSDNPGRYCRVPLPWQAAAGNVAKELDRWIRMFKRTLLEEAACADGGEAARRPRRPSRFPGTRVPSPPEPCGARERAAQPQATFMHRAWKGFVRSRGLDRPNVGSRAH
jgi:hypothetical protein